MSKKSQGDRNGAKQVEVRLAKIAQKIKTPVQDLEDQLQQMARDILNVGDAAARNQTKKALKKAYVEPPLPGEDRTAWDKQWSDLKRRGEEVTSKHEDQLERVADAQRKFDALVKSMEAGK